MKKNAAIVTLLLASVFSAAIAYHQRQLADEYRLQLLETRLELKEVTELAAMQRQIAEQSRREAVRQQEIAERNMREALVQRDIAMRNEEIAHANRVRAQVAEQKSK